METKKAKKLSIYALWLALAMMLSYVETLIPLSIGIPGAKIGLSNMVALSLLQLGRPGGAALISAARILLSGLLFGNLFSIFYSFSGFLLSFLTMLLMKRSGLFSTLGISIGGGVMHNAGQLLCAAALTGPYVMRYLPFLVPAGIAAGIVTGTAGAILLKRISVALKDSM